MHNMNRIVTLLTVLASIVVLAPLANSSKLIYYSVNYPNPGGGTYPTYPTGINFGSSPFFIGTTVGWYTDANGVSHGFAAIPDTSTSPITFSYSTIEPPGAVSSHALGINDSGYIVGAWVDSSLQEHGFFYDISTTPPTYNSFDVQIPGIAVITTTAVGINDANQIAGYYTDGSVSLHGFYTVDRINFTSIDYPGAGATSADGLNHFGELVGWYSVGSQAHGFIYNYTTGAYASFDYPKALDTSLWGVNENGDISGRYFDSSLLEHGFTWNTHSFSPIDYPGTSSGTEVFALSDAFVVPGNYNGNGFIAKPNTGKK